MTVREEWEDVSFQVIEGMDGVLRSGYFPTGEGTVQGNVAVDFVWGGMLPMQPDDDREDDGYFTLPQVEDAYWSPARLYTSELLDDTLDSHSIATTGYANFPKFLPNYAGDGDTGFEVQIPNLVRKTIAQAEDILDGIDNAGSLFTAIHDLTVSYVETTGKTVRVTAYDHDWNSWGASNNGYANSYLMGLRVGDQLKGTITITTDPTSSVVLNNAVVTKVNVDGVNSYFEYERALATPAIDHAATGTIIAGTNLVNVITLQRSTLRDEGQQVNVRVFND
ncbi:hypothetical protein UFOVP621_69 [uncultured Caudovirales phage]|uniref:Uncharacterized protein n=1 Tax=uncultured Caudovirales phage TaxID=2100421 RepID=A0A6J5N7W8_9CAUD|nr:hypothetical protein UFOVP621_69 [uncultured Caudovirales phage]